MDEDDELTLPQIAAHLGLNISTPRGWVNAGRLPAHRDPADSRRWLVYRSDLDALLNSTAGASLGRPRSRVIVEPTTREDWTDAPEEVTLDLATSVELPKVRP